MEEEEKKEEKVEKNAKQKRSASIQHDHSIAENKLDKKADKKKLKEVKTSAKQKTENNRSLRRMKKRGVVRQMFDKFPKEVRLAVKSSSNNNSSSSKNVSKEPVPEAESEYDIPSELYPGPTVSPSLQSDKNDVDTDNEDGIKNETEDIYESRKLLIRQMQGLIAKEVHGSRSAKEPVGSEYDSWSDLEENFALAYEPIPLNINMDTWRKMSKKDILKTVRCVASGPIINIFTRCVCVCVPFVFVNFICLLDK